MLVVLSICWVSLVDNRISTAALIPARYVYQIKGKLEREGEGERVEKYVIIYNTTYSY